jgi:hemolysin D
MFAADNAASILSPDALDFAPGLLAIQESPPSRMPRMVLYLTMSLFAILLAWALFAHLDIVASADGKLVPQSFLKIVQPADSGVVEEIMVKEGQEVRTGQILMRMDMKLVEADARTIDSELQQKQLALRRIDAELSNKPFLQQAGDEPDVYAQILAQYTAHRKAYLDAVAQEQEVLNKARFDLSSAQQVLSKLQRTVPIYKESAGAYDKLARDGYVGPLAAQEKQRDFIEKEQDFKAQESTVNSLKATIAQSERRIAGITSNYRSQLQNERVDTEMQAHKLRQEQIKQAHKSGFYELRAPQNGTVKDLATHTKGTVVSPGTILMTLVPKDDPLQAEVMVKNEDVGFVSVGQKVKLKLSAYTFQKYGMLDGTVVHIGADANDTGTQAAATNSVANLKGGSTQAQPQAYKALVALKTQTLKSPTGEELRLAPGMQVIGEIDQGQRTVLEYLLSPVQKVAKEAGRER